MKEGGIKAFINRRNYEKVLAAAGFLLCAVGWWFCLPSPLFQQPYCTVLLSSEGQLMDASLAADGQWRFPERGNVPAKFAAALVTYEDAWFYRHPGVNPVSLLKAGVNNITGKRKRGASTLTMQVIRLSRGNRRRSLYQKLVEMVLATRLEAGNAKEEILALYAAHAPFGGNVVGLEAASQKYFGRPAGELSWAEAATLAVLPNSPALIHPGKNRQKLLGKRNTLLNKLFSAKQIDKPTLELALSEPLPEAVLPLPHLLPHLLQRVIADGQDGKYITTTINAAVQERVERVVAGFHESLQGVLVNNAAALVVDVKSGGVLAYVGNTKNTGQAAAADYVDITNAKRSYGSLLKPLLYAAALDEGLIMPASLVMDVPRIYKGYAPRNFFEEYSGAVAADKALSRSLNLPFVNLLEEYGTGRLLNTFRKAGFTSFTKTASHYGLTLILGGAEVSMWEAAGVYSSMARKLNNANTKEASVVHTPSYTLPGGAVHNKNTLMSAQAIYTTFNALLDNERPDLEAGYKQFADTRKIAWKTGTSLGFRDAWCVGITPDYVVLVWVGNADGEGRAGLTGVQVAAPVMFAINAQLPAAAWFKMPAGMRNATVCKTSGYKAGAYCMDTEDILVAPGCLKTLPCPYHQLIHVDATARYRVTADCEPAQQIRHTPWFVLPPVAAFYYARSAAYNPLPPYRENCLPINNISHLQVVYPRQGASILIPIELNGERGKAVFQAVNSRPGAVYWHVDNTYIGTTTHFHQLAVNPPPGTHTLTIIDDEGEVVKVGFRVE